MTKKFEEKLEKEINEKENYKKEWQNLKHYCINLENELNSLKSNNFNEENGK